MNGKVNILCVDDEKNILRALTRLFLDRPDYQILTAASGEEGLKILNSRSPIPVVISDYRMPGMNGVDFLKAVRKGWPDTVRIVLSGYADASAVVSAINEGQIYKFIPKPWNEDELKTTLTKAVEWYTLHQKNIRLTEELKQKNLELQGFNENLEKLVQERTSELIFRNKVLLSYQNIFYSLPVAVIGLDLNGMITQCNKKGAEVFGKNGKNILEMNRGNAFPRKINQMIERVMKNGTHSERFSNGNLDMKVKGVFMKFPPEQEGIVLVFDWETKTG